MSKNSICTIYSYYNILKLYAKAMFVQHWFFNRIYSHTSTAVIDVIIKVELDLHRKMKNGNATNWTNIICSLIYNVKRTFANATELYKYCSKKKCYGNYFIIEMGKSNRIRFYIKWLKESVLLFSCRLAFFFLIQYFAGKKAAMFAREIW